jgi:hypothetical protein
MSAGVIIGIDPGKSGAAVSLDREGHPIEWVAADHPDEGYTVKAGGPRIYSPHSMALWLTQQQPIRLVIIEKQQSRPMEGRSSVFTTGYGFGLWVGICSALGLRYRVVPPQTWMRAVIGSKPAKGDKKARSIIEAQAQVPELPLTWGRRRKPHDGLADAALIATYGLQLIAGGDQ